MTQTANLFGRVFITCNVEAVTGLHIGGAESSLSIGGVDNVIIRDALSNRPYIPGSSLKGKMRSQMEKFHGLPQNTPIGNATIHTCKDEDEYLNCPVCQIFGLPGNNGFDLPTPTRVIVRDVRISDESVAALNGKTDLPMSEVKSEVAIDRVTSAASPRQMERVPAGAVFGPAELVYSIYEAGDLDRFANVVEGMQLLEDDYLGGSGSRGSGKVAFKDIEISTRARGTYTTKQAYPDGPFANLQALTEHLDEVQKWLAGEGVPVVAAGEG